MFSRIHNQSVGFTRIELLAVLLAIAVLAIITFPLLAVSSADSSSAQCFNNLRQIGRAVQAWGTDHRNQAPWRTLVSQGGTQPDPGGSKPGNAWSEFASMSNELVTPYVLACPADTGVGVAHDFGEYASPAFRANGTSYAINLHTTVEMPTSILCVDRNVGFSGTTACVYGVLNASAFNSFGNDGWTNAVHGARKRAPHGRKCP
jgi:competence protein ComGC